MEKVNQRRPSATPALVINYVLRFTECARGSRWNLNQQRSYEYGNN